MPRVYEYVDNPGGQSFIVMELMSHNLANFKKQMGDRFTYELAINLLLQMLKAIEDLHNRGYIHRDIKPSNFVMGKDKNRKNCYMVDFGLAKLHMVNGLPLDMRPNADFRGTIAYASLNAHLKIDLSRRDDMWSFYFVILDFLNIKIPWRNNNVKDQV